jgi:hypothetical protein
MFGKLCHGRTVPPSEWICKVGRLSIKGWRGSVQKSMKRQNLETNDASQTASGLASAGTSFSSSRRQCWIGS